MKNKCNIKIGNFEFSKHMASSIPTLSGKIKIP